jgi:hypothetical protein
VTVKKKTTPKISKKEVTTKTFYTYYDEDDGTVLNAVAETLNNDFMHDSVEKLRKEISNMGDFHDSEMYYPVKVTISVEPPEKYPKKKKEATHKVKWQ